MKYLILGEKSLINLEIDKIISDKNFYSIIKYDLNDVDISKILEELNTISLFASPKIVIVSSVEQIDNNNEFISYLEKSNDDNILILTSSEKLDERKKIIKIIYQKCKIIDTKNTDIDSFMKKEFEGYKIDFATLNMIKEYTNYNYYKIEQEINKLKMLKLEEKEINQEDVKTIVKKSFDKNIFDLIKEIDNKNHKRVFAIYYELLDNKEDELKIMSILANTFRLLYKIKILSKNKNDKELMNVLNIKNPYRLKHLKEEAYSYNSKDLLKYLVYLSELDIKIKTGVIDKKLGMELFITKI